MLLNRAILAAFVTGICSTQAGAVTIRKVSDSGPIPNANLHLQPGDLETACVPRSIAPAGGVGPGLFANCRMDGARAGGIAQFDRGASFDDSHPESRDPSLDTYLTAVSHSSIHGGYTVDPNYGTPNAFVWNSASGAYTVLASSSESNIFASNPSGSVFVGRWQDSPAVFHYDSRTGILSPDYLISASVTEFGQSGGTAYAINSGGHVVGTAHAGRSSVTHAFLFVNDGSPTGSLIDLQADAGRELAPLPSGQFYESSAQAINDSGVVVGYTFQNRSIYERNWAYCEVKPRAFWWKPTRAVVAVPSAGTGDGTFHALPFAHSKALAINNTCGDLRAPLMVGYYLPERSREIDNVFAPFELERFQSADDPRYFGETIHELLRGPSLPFRKHAFAYLAADDASRRQFLDLTEVAPYVMSTPGHDSAESDMDNWQLEVATGVDDSGRIIGFGTFRNRPAGFVLDGICAFMRNRARQIDWSRQLNEPTVLAPTIQRPPRPVPHAPSRPTQTPVTAVLSDSATMQLPAGFGGRF